MTGTTHNPPALPRKQAGLALLAAVTMLALAGSANAFSPTECAASRFGANLNCTANDVSITNLVAVGGQTSCEGGTSFVTDLEATVTAGGPGRYDIGLFIPQDGKSPQRLPASGGSASCKVASLPFAPAPFRDLDGDSCGDIKGPPNFGTVILTGVTVHCQAVDASGKLSIPFVVSWDQQFKNNCLSADDLVPATRSKCNAPTSEQSTVDVVVLPRITKSDGRDAVTPGEATTYLVTVTNLTGQPLPQAPVLTDPAVANLLVTGVTCAGAAGGATCPVAAGVTVAALQGGGISIPVMPDGGAVTFAITAVVTGNPSGPIVNAAHVTLLGQTGTATDSNRIGYPSLTHLKTVTPASDPVNGTADPKQLPGAMVDYHIGAFNSGEGRTDPGTLVFVDMLPPDVSFYAGDLGGPGSGPVLFSDGTPASGVSWTFQGLGSATDSLEFSSDHGASWSYTPTPDAQGFDGAVTGLRMRPGGFLAPSTGSGDPGFTLTFRAKIR